MSEFDLEDPLVEALTSAAAAEPEPRMPDLEKLTECWCAEDTVASLERAVAWLKSGHPGAAMSNETKERFLKLVGDALNEAIEHSTECTGGWAYCPFCNVLNKWGEAETCSHFIAAVGPDLGTQLAEEACVNTEDLEFLCDPDAVPEELQDGCVWAPCDTPRRILTSELDSAFGEPNEMAEAALREFGAEWVWTTAPDGEGMELVFAPDEAWGKVCERWSELRKYYEADLERRLEELREDEDEDEDEGDGEEK